MPAVNKYKTREDQSIFDITLQEAGTMDALFDIIMANQEKITSLSEPVGVGVKLVKESQEKSALVVNYYQNNKIAISTAHKRFYYLIDSEGYFLQDSVSDNLQTKEY